MAEIDWANLTQREITAYATLDKKKAKRKIRKSRKKYRQEFRHGFYATDTWKKLRYETLKKYGAECQCCGRSRKLHGVTIHIDHIKPISKYPELKLNVNNLQVLCDDCNLGKFNRDTTDWREIPYVPRTFKEALALYPSLECKPHEWDNRTTLENIVYLLKWLMVLQPPVSGKATKVIPTAEPPKVIVSKPERLAPRDNGQPRRFKDRADRNPDPYSLSWIFADAPEELVQLQSLPIIPKKVVTKLRKNAY